MEHVEPAAKLEHPAAVEHIHLAKDLYLKACTLERPGLSRMVVCRLAVVHLDS